jgi:signal transduction histidine kinase
LVVPTAIGPRTFETRLVPEISADGLCTAVLSVSSDVTAYRQGIEEGTRARALAEALREATTELTRSLDRGTVLATLLDRLRAVLAFDRASVLVLEDSALRLRAEYDGTQVVSLDPETGPVLDPTHNPLFREILTSGQAMVIPNIKTHGGWSPQADPDAEASWMGVPLFARGEVAGLFAISKREPDFFQPAHLELAEAMSLQASVAVENAILYEQMQASAARMRLLSRRLVEAQESERRHVARELHDEAGQALVSLRIGLRLLEREIEEGGSVASRFAELVERTDSVMESLHRVAADLRPASLDHLGLEAALRQYARTTEIRHGLEVSVQTDRLRRARLPAAVETALYRIVQEAMVNVVRHAGATQVDIGVTVHDGRVVLEIEDNGVGIEPDHATSGDHLGLLGVRERAEALGGALTIESVPGKGTKLTVEVSSDDPRSDR